MEFFTTPRIFRHPEPERRAASIYPVFLPFSGCRERCVFCAQHIQTGRPALDEAGEAFGPSENRKEASGAECRAELRTDFRADEAGSAPGHGARGRARTFAARAGMPDVERNGRPRGMAVLRETESVLLQRRDAGLPPPEAAFYGGTFTAQPEPILALCLETASGWFRQGLVSGLRCSTRPDAVDSSVLERLQKAGFSCVELGVQSFSDRALERSRRGYGRETALGACALVRRAGLRLGAQLMPGMPGHERDDALADAVLAASLRPDFVRLYPCLVLEGTMLAAWWRQKAFTPWALDETASFLARACLLFWHAGVPVARMGLAEEPGLAENVLAGPRHPALGNMARAEALYHVVAEEAAALAEPSVVAGAGPDSGSDFWAGAVAGPRGILVPRRYQGEFFGVGGALRPAYEALGIRSDGVRFVDGDVFTLGVLSARAAGLAGSG